MAFRRTLAKPITVSGTALHAGVTVIMTLAPAAPDSGIIFRRADRDVDIPARFDLVTETRLGTVIASGDVKVAVIEHLMAAVAGAGIDDLLVTLDGPEPPILDGDALSYLTLLDQAGIKDSTTRRRAIQVLKPVRVADGDASAALLPNARASYRLEIDFPVIGQQAFELDVTADTFRQAIAPARTFGFLKELEGLHDMGLARGASLQNTLALNETGLANRELQRFDDEFVRHKILDAIGDMALAGAPLLARFEGVKSGHGLNNRLLRALFAEPENYKFVDFPDAATAVL